MKQTFRENRKPGKLSESGRRPWLKLAVIAFALIFAGAARMIESGESRLQFLKDIGAIFVF